MSMGINMPGCGIAMSLPVTSIGGARAMKYLIGDIKEEDCEVGAMEEKQIYPYDLIMAIAEHGTSDLVMDAARGAGAAAERSCTPRAPPLQERRSFSAFPSPTKKRWFLSPCGMKRRTP